MTQESKLRRLVPETKVFVSHTKEDEDFCDKFDSVCSREGVIPFRSEFEKISKPEWSTIKKAMNESSALFFLVGKNLVELQEKHLPEWRYTQNWIAYEIGLACQMEIDVWAVCDNVLINFPMPYINNYLTISLKDKDTFNYVRYIVLDIYKQGKSFPLYSKSVEGKTLTAECASCGALFNLHVRHKKGEGIRCPQCLQDLIFPEGHLL